MEKITVKQLLQLAKSEIVVLVAPPGSGKSTLLQFVATSTSIPVLDTDALGYRDGGAEAPWIIDLGALRKMALHMRHGIIAGWGSNIKEVVRFSQEQGWTLVGRDLSPDERHRILDVARQRLRIKGSPLTEDPAVSKAIKDAMNMFRKFKFPYLLLSPEDVYVKSNFKWEQATGRTPIASDLRKVIGIVKDSWTNLRGWFNYRKNTKLSLRDPKLIEEVESILKSQNDRNLSRKDGDKSARDSSVLSSETIPSDERR